MLAWFCIHDRKYDRLNLVSLHHAAWWTKENHVGKGLSLHCMVHSMTVWTLLMQIAAFSPVFVNWVIPYVTVTIFVAFFGLILPVNYLLLARDQLLFACLQRGNRSSLWDKISQFMSIQFLYGSLFSGVANRFKLLVNSLKVVWI